MERIKQLLASTDPIKWIFYGDSITHGAYHTLGARDYCEVFEERIRTELARSGDIVIKTAYNGNTTRDLLASFDWRIRQFSPQVVFMMIGMNDCSSGRQISQDEFRSNLQQLGSQMAELGAIPVLQTTCPILPGTTPCREPHFESYMQIVRDVATQGGWPLIDHLAHWQENRAKHYYWMHDPFHPNGAGHLVFAHTVLRALGIFDESSNVCRMFVP